MTKVYDSIIFLLLILVFVGFVWLQKEDIQPVGPITYLEKQGFQNQGSPGAAIPLPTRTLETNAAKKTVCNLQKVFDTLQCSAYLAKNPGPPTTASIAPASTIPPPPVVVTGNIDNLSNVARANGNSTNAIKPNDMIYFGYTLDMQGPFVVKNVSFDGVATVITFTTKYIGPNIQNSILSLVSSSASPTASSGTTPVIEAYGSDEVKKEVYTFGTKKIDYTLDTAAAACATFGGEVATLAQMKLANKQGFHSLWFTLVKDDTGGPIAVFSKQTANIAVPAGIVTFVAANNSGLACYGVKPPEGTVAPNGDPILPFSKPTGLPEDANIPLLYNNPNTIVGSVTAGTNYIRTINDVLPENLKIGDLVYIQGRCNKYDTDNGDGTCTAYDCKTGETDVLGDNMCQMYKCRDRTATQTDHINNSDGTCTVPTEYASCNTSAQLGFTDGWNLVYQNGGYVQGNVRMCIVPGGKSFATPIINLSYSYNSIKAGVKSTTYTKTSANPSYKYAKVIGPYYIAATPAIGTLLLKSKVSGDFDANGKFTSISSYSWKVIAVTSPEIPGATYISLEGSSLYYLYKINKFSYTDSEKTAFSIPDIFDTTLQPVKLLSSDMAYFRTKDLDSNGTYSNNKGYHVGAGLEYVNLNNVGSPWIGIPQYNSNGVKLYNTPFTFGFGTRISYDGFNDTVMAINSTDNTVWWADTNIYTAPNWTQLTGASFRDVSHSNSKCVGIGTDNKIYYQSDWKNYSTKIDITGIIQSLLRVSFDGYSMRVAVVNSAGAVYYKDLSNLKMDTTNKVSATFGLQNVVINKVTSTDDIITRLVKKGSIKNYGMCTSSGIVLDLANKNRVPGDDTALTATKQGLCSSYFNSQSPTVTSDDRKDEYKKPMGFSLNKKIIGCPAGTEGSTSSCEPCPSGKSSINAGVCTPCTDGKFCPGGVAAIPCPAGQSSIAGATCMPCPAGKSSISGGVCTPCTDGKFCPGGVAETPCPPGQTSIAGGTCVPCPAGYYCAGGDPAVQCLPGTFSSTAGAISCTQCAAGQFSLAGSTRCTACSPGQYSSAPGSDKCLWCVPGTYSSTAGAISCTQCPPGTYMSGSGATACANCPTGITSTAGQRGCMSCAVGWIDMGQTCSNGAQNVQKF